MSRRKRANLSPSLFPFLAVLVCTLGTLILLLALVSQDATDNAKRQADAKRAKAAVTPVAKFEVDSDPKPPRLEAAAVAQMVDEEDFRVSQLVAFRDKQTADLEDRRDKLAHIENHITRLRAELKQLSDEVDRAVSDDPIADVDENELTRYQKQIDDKKQEIEELKAGSGGKTPRVVIVPHKGPNGTDRRPIYLECVDDGLTIWPEGTRITASQLADSDSSANPLNAALRVVRHHAMQTYGDTTSPYPLLVVRPGGIETYGLARNAMEDWDDQFGYELVPDEVKLAYAKPDSNLKRELEDTIAREVRKKSTMMATGRGYGVGGSGSGGAGYGSGPKSRPRILSAASLDRDGRSNGFHTDRGSEDYGSSSYGRSPYVSSSAIRGADGQLARSSGASRYTGASSHLGTGSGVQANSAGIDPQTEQRWADDMKVAASEMKSGGFAGDGSFARGVGGSMSDPLNALGAGTSGGSGSLGGTDQSTGEEGGEDAEQMDQAGSKSAQGLTAAGSKPGAFDLSGPANGSRVDGKGNSTRGVDADGAPLAGASRQSGSATSRMSAGSTGTGGNQSSGSASQSPGSQSSRSQAGTASSSLSDSNQQGTPSPSFQKDLSPKQDRDLVRRQGRDWALPSEVAGAQGNAIVRTMRVQCYDDHFVLLSTRGSATEMFGFLSGDVERATLELATSVRDQVERWGAALPGGRWQPRLDVEVMPGAESRFNQLRSLMDGSGVEVLGRQSQ
ncbi:hypothetical protein [Rubripirellula reticaptiva]|uniref:IncA protein n=1 Tax=Rubripirellula reticaptiva TaxID=2528013 RepID=A0A5C6FCE8_9BACT|nr:hypothetical protein [Rubripirellula reticaptiva]TWU57251.1 hypothetical protein Poly59_01580 [Rubripirellula reticaptiva]